MRLAVIADIHSNAPALEAVLADIDQQGVDDVIVVGDFINGGPFPREVLDILYDRQPQVLLGNHERYIQDVTQPNFDETAYPRERWGVVYWTLDYLNQADLAYIDSLPITIELDNLLLVHGSPRDLRGGILPDTPDDCLQEHFGEVSHPYVVTAHTHRPFVREWGNLTFINPGSVGMPVGWQPRCQLCDFDTHEWARGSRTSSCCIQSHTSRTSRLSTWLDGHGANCSFAGARKPHRAAHCGRLFQTP